MTEPISAAAPGDISGLLERQKLDLPGVENARQLGGYIVADGRRVKQNLLLRTAGLDKATDETIKQLSEKYRVCYVADFRMPPEAALAPDRAIPGAKYVRIELMEIDASSPESREAAEKIRAAGNDNIGKLIEYAKTGSLSGLYSGILLSDTGQRGFAQFFRLLLGSGGGAVLWHCSFGKDRTGLAAALLLYALGADDETVMRDFLLTNEVLKDKISFLKEEMKRRRCSVEVRSEAEAIAGVKGEYLSSALGKLREEYGSVLGYIHRLGVTDENIAELRKMYLEEVTQ